MWCPSRTELNVLCLNLPLGSFGPCIDVDLYTICLERRRDLHSLIAPLKPKRTDASKRKRMGFQQRPCAERFFRVGFQKSLSTQGHSQGDLFDTDALRGPFT